MIAVMVISGAISFIPQYKLMIYLREKYVKRWAKLVGAKSDGKQWIGGWGIGFDGLKYIYGKMDNEIAEIFRLKRTIKICLLFVFVPFAIFVFNFATIIIIWILNGCPKIQ
jgi:hypothetical protein